MKFKSPVYATASGSIAGVTYSRNKSGLFTRARTRPVNPSTNFQQVVRQYFGYLVRAWSEELTDAQRTGWETWAQATPTIDRSGKSVIGTGQAAWIRVNTVRRQGGLNREDDPPTVFSNGNPISKIELRGSGQVNAIGINLAGTDLSFNAFIPGGANWHGDLFFYVGRPVNASRTFPKGPYQFAVARPVFNGTETVNMTFPLNQLLNTNGAFVPGQTRNVRFRMSYDISLVSETYSLVAPIVTDSI